MEHFLKNTTILQISFFVIILFFDFWTGYAKAVKKGNVTSRQMGDGFNKKVTQFFFVVLLLLISYSSSKNADISFLTIPSFALYNGIIIGYIVKEFISIVENMIEINALDGNNKLIKYLLVKLKKIESEQSEQ